MENRQRKVKFFETDNFKTVQREWYAILKTKGFKDEEVIRGSDTYLVQYTQNTFRFMPTKTQVDAKQDYFIRISHNLRKENFKKPRDMHIMRMRAKGCTLLEIARILDIHRQTVRFTIRKYENKWNLRRWSKAQMTSNRVTA